ncbi:MAG: Ig-like domain-containing protein [Prevotellaceae bacterium]|jgi:uncharacterized protein (TIGR02145 family)|nr:Ig-like domain-containing protein [Prevotellaceae bacterium]
MKKKVLNFFGVALLATVILSACKPTNEPVKVTGVSLNKQILSLVVGTSGQLTATVSPNDAADKSVSWTSSDNSIVTVADGNVTAVAVGEATITVTTADGNKTATCAVTVVANAIPAESITLDKTEHTLNVGDDFTLTATVLPANSTDNVEWQTSNAAVATVADGVVTAVAVGEATITAKAGEKTATCNVTVTPVSIPAESIALDIASLTLTIGEGYTLTATVLPANSTESVVWTSSDNAKAMVVNGLVTAVSDGSAIITATAGTKSATCQVSVKDGVRINGVIWAKYNVNMPNAFATTPESAGMFYQWNRKIGWSSTDPMTNSNGGTTWDDTNAAGTEWETGNDPSPAGWRVPTLAQIETLLDTEKVASEWTRQNNINGRKFTDLQNGNTLFLPAAGGRSDSDGTLYGAGAGAVGYCWSSTQYSSDGAYFLHFNSMNAYTNHYNRSFGICVRPVAE